MNVGSARPADAGRALVAALVVVALVVVGASGGVGWYLLHRSHHVQWQGTAGAPSVSLDLPAGVADPRISAQPKPTAHVPAFFTATGPAVRIESAPLDGATATLTLTYDPSISDATAQDRLQVLTFSDRLGVWLPVGGDLDTAHHRITVQTGHFSDWVVALTDPDAYKAALAADEDLTKGVGGLVLKVMYGETDATDCDPARLLLPARLSFINGSQNPTQLCEDVESDGRYRLVLTNTSWTPIALHVPAGFTPDTGAGVLKPIEDIINQQAAGDGPDKPVVLGAGKKVAFTFADAALPDRSVEITGKVSWSASVAQLVYSGFLIFLGDIHEDAAEWRKVLGAYAELSQLNDCVAKTARSIESLVTTGPSRSKLQKALKDGVYDCLPIAATVAFDIVKAEGKGLVKSAVRGVKSIAKVLDLPDDMTFVRNELGALFDGIGAAGGVDLSMRVQPVRVMNLREVLALPHSCAAPQADSYLPAGADPQTSALCTTVGDLDGNGQQDALLFWRRPLTTNDPDYDRDPNTGPPGSFTAPDGPYGFRWGAVAYLDDGTFHLLEEKVFAPAGSGVAPLVPLPAQDPVAIPGPGGRSLGAVVAQEGSSTNWYALFTVTADKRLHVLQDAKSQPFQIPTGGAAAYSSGYGCVTEGGRQLLAIGSRQTEPLGSTNDYVGLAPYAVDGFRVTPTGEGLTAYRDTSTAAGAAQQHLPWLPGLSGLGCTSAPGDLGPAVPPANSPERAVTDLIAAAAAKNVTAGERRMGLNPTLLANPAPAKAGIFDVWSQLTRRYDAHNWAASTPTCTPLTLTIPDVQGSRCTIPPSPRAAAGAKPLVITLSGVGGAWTVLAVATQADLAALAAAGTAADGTFQLEISDVQGTTVGFTKVQFLTGAAAAKGCAQDGVVPGDGAQCHDYYIRHPSTTVLHNALSPNAAIKDYDYTSMQPIPVTPAAWLASVAQRTTQTKLWQATVSGGQITRLDPIYTP